MTPPPDITALYFTDPACPWSWAFEPAIRRLETELAGVEVRYVMAGMAREFPDPAQLARTALEAGLESGMPVDPRIWWEGPPSSSYPACIAVKAAAEQGHEARYLRRLREGLLCRRRKLDTAEALVEEARAVPGLDIERFRVDLGSHAMLEAFGADLESARRDGERVSLPSVDFGAGHAVYGPVPYEELREAALAAGARPRDGGPPALETALRHWGSMATVEVSEVCRLPGPRGAAELWLAASEWRVVAERAGTGELWRLS